MSKMLPTDSGERELLRYLLEYRTQRIEQISFRAGQLLLRSAHRRMNKAQPPFRAAARLAAHGRHKQAAAKRKHAEGMMAEPAEWAATRRGMQALLDARGSLERAARRLAVQENIPESDRYREALRRYPRIARAYQKASLAFLRRRPAEESIPLLETAVLAEHAKNLQDPADMKWVDAMLEEWARSLPMLEQRSIGRQKAGPEAARKRHERYVNSQESFWREYTERLRKGEEELDIRGSLAEHYGYTLTEMSRFIRSRQRQRDLDDESAETTL